MRARRQQLDKIGKGAVAADGALFESDPAQWRKENAAASDPDDQVRAAARSAVKNKYSTFAKVKSQMTIKPKLRLNKRHYKSWKKMWENLDSSEASNEFDDDYDKAGC